MSESECAICWEYFLEPRFLSCKHTFCTTCLNDCIEKEENISKIACPICRQETELPHNEVTYLFENYFVPLREPPVPDVLCCEFCFKEADVSTCPHCEAQFCNECHTSHKLAIKLSGQTYPGLECDDPDADITDDAQLPIHLLFCSLVRTKFNACLISNFPVKSMINAPSEDEENLVHCILPLEDRCIALANLTGEVMAYGINGEEMNRDLIEGDISSITMCQDGSFYLTVFNGHCVLLADDLKISVLMRTKTYNPASIASFRDKRFVVSLFQSEVEIPDTAGGKMQIEKHGAVQICDCKGQIIHQIVMDGVEYIFKRPSYVAISPQDNSTVCVSDNEKGCVFFFSEGGSLLTTYKGQTTPSFIDRRAFSPMGIAFDSEDRLVVMDLADNVIHILLSNGNFIGFIATRNPSFFGNPFSLAVDKEDNVWLGDRKDGRIRVFEITSYVNHLKMPLQN